MLANPLFPENRASDLRHHPLRYVTVDRWESQETYDAFRATIAQQYEEIDRLCQGYTTRERLIGEFGEDE